MGFLPKVRRLLRVREPRVRDQAAGDVEAEIRFHLETRAEELVREGVPREEAVRRAREEFGDLERADAGLRERAARRERRRRWTERLGGVAGDLRYAVRQLRKSPGVTAACVLSLGLAIGAATAIFGIADPLLLRPLPYGDSERLVTVWNTYPGWRGHPVLGAFWDGISLSYPEYRALREGSAPLEEVAIFGTNEMALTGEGEPRRLRVGVASASLFRLLGARPAAGRLFVAAEEGPAAPRIAVLSHRLWRERFGGRRGAVGRTLRLDGETYTVVGALPAGFRFPTVAASPGYDLWIPVGADGAELDASNHEYEGIARLASGTGRETAETAVAAVLRGDRDPRTRGARLEPRRESEVGRARGGLLLLLGAVGVLLAIACANVATLLLGRVARRGREIATRAALGADGRRIGRLLVSESVLVGLLGAAAAVPIALIGRGALLDLAPDALGLAGLPGLDLRVYAFGAILGVLTGVAFGLAPAWVARKPDLRSTLQTAGRDGMEAAGAAGGVQRGLIAAQVALSLVLLVATALLARSLTARLAVDPGFRADDLLTVELTLPERRYPSATEVSVGLGRIVSSVASLPEVGAVTGASAVPFSGEAGSSSFEIAGREVGPDAKKPEALRRAVLPGYHETLGIPLVGGRGVEARDRDDAPRVAVVSRAMADRFWPGRSPLGETILWDDLGWSVVGVVGDVLHEALEEEVKPAFYIPLHQAPDRRDLTLLAQTADGRGQRLADRLRAAVWAADPALPADEIGTLRAYVARATGGPRFRAFLVGAFGVTALLLAAVGIFGVTARAVTARRRELGIRIALGADRPRLVRQAVRREARGLAVGMALGLAGAVATAGILRRFLFGVELHDPTTYLLATALLGLLVLGASWLAARRATRFDAARVIRAE